MEVTTITFSASWMKATTQMNTLKINPFANFLKNLAAIIVAYYVSLLLHEWGHGFVAWLYGVKTSPFDVQYGGYFLQNADENVDYVNLMASGQGVAGALIAIAGPVVSLFILLIALIMLCSNKINNKPLTFTFIYWLLIMNMVPSIQYLSVSPFVSGGDTGHFAQGLNFSSWWIFVPGTFFIVFMLDMILKKITPKAYVVIRIKSLWGKNLFLLISLCIMFLFIYTHGYNPLTDKGLNLFTKVMVAISICMVPILFIICNPAREWVKKSILN